MLREINLVPCHWVPFSFSRSHGGVGLSLAINSSMLYMYIFFFVGIAVLSRRQGARGSIVKLSPLAVARSCDTNAGVPCFARFMSSKSSEQRGQTASEVCVQFEFL